MNIVNHPLLSARPTSPRLTEEETRRATRMLQSYAPSFPNRATWIVVALSSGSPLECSDMVPLYITGSVENFIILHRNMSEPVLLFPHKRRLPIVNCFSFLDMSAICARRLATSLGYNVNY